MRRGILPTNAGVFEPIFFVEISHSEGETLNFSTGTHPYEFDGKVWNPVSYLGKIGDVQEVLGIEVGRMQVALTGIPGFLYPQVANIRYRSKKMRVLIGLMRDTLMMAQPKTLFTGKVVEYNLQAGPEMGIVLTGASNLVTVKRSNVSRYTHADQRIKFPNDKGLIFVADLKNLSLQWGS